MMMVKILSRMLLCVFDFTICVVIVIVVVAAFSVCLFFRFMFLLVYQCDAKAIGTHAQPPIYFHCRFNILSFFSRRLVGCLSSPFSILRYSHLNVCVLDVCVEFWTI